METRISSKPLNLLKQSEPQRWIDGHCHLADPRFEGQIDSVLQRSRSANVHGWVQGGTCPQDWERQKLLQKRVGTGVILSFGIHPVWAAQMTEQNLKSDLKILEEQIHEAAGLGELGLDYSSPHCPKTTYEIQKSAFEQQIVIAQEAKKPLILHIVQAHADALRILRRFGPYSSGGIVHLFSGSAEIAKQYLDLGFFISLGGTISKEGFKKIKRAIHSLPLERIIVETDAPDQLPRLPGVEPDTMNEPAHLIKIAEFLGTCLQEDPHRLLSSSTRSLENLFGIEI